MADIDMIELPGRVMLPDGGEHDCSLLCGPMDEVELVLTAGVLPGAQVVCHVPSLGVVEGTAGDTTGSGCRLTMRGTPAHQARLASRIAWHRRRAAGHDDQRAAQRVSPAATAVRVGWPDGRAVAGILIDLSATGAALQSPDRPDPGMQVVVGKRRAVVVRLLEQGFAVRFALPLRPEDVNADTVL